MPLEENKIRKVYKLAGLKVNRVVRARLGDGYYVYHPYGAESYSKTYPGRRRDFIDAFSTDSLKIHIIEARNRAGLPKLKNIHEVIRG